MSFFETARDIVAPARVYRCRECATVSALNALNQAMLCEVCGEPDEDGDYAPTEDELRRDETTWRL